MTGPRLSVVIPCYNEERRLEAGVRRVAGYLDARGEPYEILAVDDGSRDGTLGLARRLQKEVPALRAIPLGRNRGKGAAVREGMISALGERILMTDADLSTPIEDLERLESRTEDVVIASRKLAASEIDQPASRKLAGDAFNAAVRMVALPGIRDTQCGFKLWSAAAARAVFPRMKLERFAFDVESLWLARRLGFRVAEVPCRWTHDDRSTVKLARDGMRMGVDLLRILLRRTLDAPYGGRPRSTNGAKP